MPRPELNRNQDGVCGRWPIPSIMKYAIEDSALEFVFADAPLWFYDKILAPREKTNSERTGAQARRSAHAATQAKRPRHA